MRKIKSKDSNLGPKPAQTRFCFRRLVRTVLCKCACLTRRGRGAEGRTHRGLHQQLARDGEHAGQADRGAHCRETTDRTAHLRPEQADHPPRGQGQPRDSRSKKVLASLRSSHCLAFPYLIRDP